MLMPRRPVTGWIVPAPRLGTCTGYPEQEVEILRSQRFAESAPRAGHSRSCGSCTGIPVQLPRRAPPCVAPLRTSLRHAFAAAELDVGSVEDAVDSRLILVPARLVKASSSTTWSPSGPLGSSQQLGDGESPAGVCT